MASSEEWIVDLLKEIPTDWGAYPVHAGTFLYGDLVELGLIEARSREGRTEVRLSDKGRIQLGWAL